LARKGLCAAEPPHGPGHLTDACRRSHADVSGQPRTGDTKTDEVTRRDEEPVTKFLFDNESFSFETLSTAGSAAYGGADLGQVLTTASHIGEGDEESWHQARKATAQRVAEIGEQALASGHRVSAREACCRASNYYRTAADFLLEHPATDPEITVLSAGQPGTFAAAAALFDTPVHDVSIPYEAPPCRPTCSSSATPAPHAPRHLHQRIRLHARGVLLRHRRRRAAPRIQRPGLRRPGQGDALREQKLVMRPDWEAVITPFVDYAVTRGEIAADKIVLFGYSLGGYLVARAAAFAGNLPPYIASCITRAATTSPSPYRR
jgi:hypothetical protein